MCAQTDTHQGVPVIDGSFPEAIRESAESLRCRPCVVDEQVEPPGVVGDGGEDLRDRGVVGVIARDRSGAVGALAATGGDVDEPSGVDESAGDTSPDAATAARHERNAIVAHGVSGSGFSRSAGVINTGGADMNASRDPLTAAIPTMALQISIVT